MVTEPATAANPSATSLTARHPVVPVDRLLAELVPPRLFVTASFDSYRPDPAHPSQQHAVTRLRQVAADVAAGEQRSWWRPRRRRAAPAVYLDGGFGVGKTHLLAALAHATGSGTAAGTGAAYGTFVEYTNLVGALGFLPTVEALAAHRIVCIDEFELDDPGDTVLVTRLLRELADRGVAVAATSNTLPGSLGEGRFAAEDFLREIQALAARFEVLRVDGDDYRHRAVVTDAPGLPDVAVRTSASLVPGATIDPFVDLLAHLATVHPSRYGALLDGVTLVALTGVGTIHSQDVALRFVVLVDRLYDRDVPVVLGGAGEQQLFTPEMLAGGYRKKYYRALSRLGALTGAGRAMLAT
ncbi:MAG TPA: cell division protein ZapE [Cellulomonas sp.]|uniref:cell division protein ZapE n=1 Tax=Cellulomonas sp. TaxID=40001 RepID=UPI002E3460DA|nr:cell division protein ZapE [Cellulomonas sp.]HEX5332403.1 cell division protein ZapE [Cellulomonas sp.]